MSDYKLVKKLSESAIVRNKSTGNLELWGINSSLNENTFILIIEGKEYKFVTSDSKKIANAIKEMTATGAIAGYSTPFAFTKNKKGKVVKVSFGGTTGLNVKIDEPGARSSFAARHKCATKKDKTKPGYWACNIGRYWKSLGGSRNFSGYW